MDNKEIALKLTIAALENDVIEFPVNLSSELRSEPIKEFYFDILDSLEFRDEEE